MAKDICEEVVKHMVKKAYEEGKMFEFILGFREFWGDPHWANKYEKVAKREFKKLLRRRRDGNAEGD